MEAESTQSTESTETYLKAMAWLHANQKMLIIVTSVVVVIALAMGFMSWQKSQTESDANADLLSVPLATVHGNQMAPAPANSFLDVAKKFPDTSAGEYAQLLGAGALFTEGKYADARQEFSKFIDEHSGSSLLAQARMGVAASLEGEGKISEAAQKYQEIISIYSADGNIVSPAKLTLGRLYEQLNKPEQALTYYSELARVNNPYDPWAVEARERGTDLLAKHPELRKAMAPPPASAPPGMRPAGTSPFAPSSGAATPKAPSSSPSSLKPPQAPAQSPFAPKP